jgi:pimeloyl-ACP methyl ester carboxylesterase
VEPQVRVTRAYAEGPFGQIHYRIARPEAPASAPPLLCLHQSPKSGRDYAALMAHLGRERVVIAPDTPGYGQSDAPGTPPTIEHYAAAMIDLLATLRHTGELPAGSIDLMGYHTGGVIAASLAAREPELVRRIVFVSLAAFDLATRTERLAHMDVFAVPREDNGNIDALLTLGDTLNDKRLGPEWRHRALAEILWTGMRMPWGFRAVYDHDMAADLGALTQPVLVLCPRDDLWDETHANLALLQDARLVEFPEAGNGFLELDTEEVAGVIRGFLG